MRREDLFYEFYKSKQNEIRKYFYLCEQTVNYKHIKSQTLGEAALNSVQHLQQIKPA